MNKLDYTSIQPIIPGFGNRRGKYYEINDIMGSGSPMSEDRPIIVVQRESGEGLHQVHAGIEVGIQRSDVAPVAPLKIGVARDSVGRVVIDMGLALTDESRN